MDVVTWKEDKGSHGPAIPEAYEKYRGQLIEVVGFRLDPFSIFPPVVAVGSSCSPTVASPASVASPGGVTSSSAVRTAAPAVTSSGDFPLKAWQLMLHRDDT